MVGDHQSVLVWFCGVGRVGPHAEHGNGNVIERQHRHSGPQTGRKLPVDHQRLQALAAAGKGESVFGAPAPHLNLTPGYHITSECKCGKIFFAEI